MSWTKIAVGVDLSPSSELAVAQAMSLARHVGASVVLVHAAPVPDAGDGLPATMRATAGRYQGVLLERLDRERTELEALRQRLSGQGVDVSRAIIDGHPDLALTRAAVDLGADLIAVGTHGRTGVRRLMLGSVAEKTIRRASASVLVARGDARAAEGGFRRVLVGTDFSSMADRALACAVEVAAPDARIEVVHAWSVPPDLTLDGWIQTPLATLREDLAADALRAGTALLADWKARGRALAFHAVEAASSAALVDRAEETGADLIVVGSHGHRGLDRLLLGSVAESTARHAPCSVLVARAPRTAAATAGSPA